MRTGQQPPLWRRLFRMAMLSALALVALAVELVPSGLSAGARPSPDLVLCLLLAMVLRRPEAVPLVLVWLLGLVRDLLTDLPVGGGTLSLIMAVELARLWRGRLARRPFPAEWAAAALFAFATVAVQWLIVVVSLSDPPPLSRLAEQAMVTALVYPVFVVLLRWILGVTWRKLPAQEARAR